MIAHILPNKLEGTIDAISSKSHLQRILICAAISDRITEIEYWGSSGDIETTCNCLASLCADINKGTKNIKVTPKEVSLDSVLHCRESGATYRFLLPLSSALGANSGFILSERLALRPIEPLYIQLEAHGIKMEGKGTPFVSSQGQLFAGKYILSGNVSSQFISGLLFALPLLEKDSVIQISDTIESAGYIDLSCSVLKEFGIKTINQENRIDIMGNQKYISPGKMVAEGDWSNSAYWLASAAIGQTSISCKGLKVDSMQRDKMILELLSLFGAEVKIEKETISVYGKDLKGINIDAKDIPDLVPTLAAIAVYAEGETCINNVNRLRFKESNRIETISLTLKQLGADIRENENSIIIRGKNNLNGGTVSSCNDHRIAMMAALVSLRCVHPVIIEGMEAVIKSYPGFLNDFIKLGGIVEREGK